MAIEAAESRPAALSAARDRRRRPPVALAALAALVAACAALPAGYLAVTVVGDFGASVDSLWRERTAELALGSVTLAAAVTVSALALAVPLAWLTARTDLPGRRLWTVAAVLPLVIPSYIGAYLFVSALGPRGLLAQGLETAVGIERIPSLYGFTGAWIVLTLFTYPLALLPVRAALARLDPQLEDAARGLGRSPWATFRTVILPQLAPAIGAGGLLVALYTLHDFGAVSILRFDTFTRGIYTAYKGSFDRTSAAALAALLMLIAFAVLALEARLRGRGAYHRSAPGGAPAPRVVALGRWRAPALAFCAAVVGFALVLPVAVLVYWSLRSVAGEIEWALVAVAARNSLLAAGLAAGVAVVCAVPVALLAARFPGRLAAAAERGAYVGYALPGLVVALSLVYFGTRVAPALYQTLALLVFAWVVLFLPQAVGTARASLLQVPPRLEEAARSLGRSPLSVLRTITVPLTASGLLAGAALVFLTAIKELPAALILAPTGFDLLATEIWSATNVAFFERGAVPALVLLVVSAYPVYLLTARDEPAAGPG